MNVIHSLSFIVKMDEWTVNIKRKDDVVKLIIKTLSCTKLILKKIEFKKHMH